MPQHTAAQITKLCDDWCSASSGPEGVMVQNANTDSFRLLANGVEFHELSHEALCAALIGLSKVMLRQRLSSSVALDHYALWSWCGELLFAPYPQLFPQEPREICSLYKTSIHAALARCEKPTTLEESRERHWRLQELQPHYATQLLQQSHLVLAYLGFPLLEAVLKRACSAYVGFNGEVISEFSVPRKNGTPKLYLPKGTQRREKHSSQCNSLRDLLVLHHTTIAGERLKVLLDRFREHLHSLDETQDPFDLIYSWRNQSLHGETNFQTIGGSLLNLSLLITLFEFEPEFEQRRLHILQFIQGVEYRQHRPHWSFYPPY